MEKEHYRLKATKRYLNLNANKEHKLDDIAMLASHITGTPVAFITLVDKEIQWMSACFGHSVQQMPMATSFCKHTILQDDVFMVNDTFKEEKFSHYPVVQSNPAARFYAGTPLRSYDGYNIGTLCVLDIKPNQLNNEQQNCLKALSRQVANILELNLSQSLLQKNVAELEEKNTAVALQNKNLKEIAQIQSHQFREPLCSVMSLMNLIKMEDYAVNRDYMIMMESAVNKLDEKICSVVNIASKVA
jgi:GAF domain-containing protein